MIGAWCLMLDACLMVRGSWIKAHGSWPREARGGSWPGAGPWSWAMSLPWPPLAMSHEPWALSHEPWTIKHASRTSNIEKSRRKLMFLRFCKVRCRDNKGGWVPELFSTLPTYQNPINMNPGPLLCKVSWICQPPVSGGGVKRFSNWFVSAAHRWSSDLHEVGICERTWNRIVYHLPSLSLT